MSSRKKPVRQKSPLAEWRRDAAKVSVRFIRKELGITQQDLADHLHTYQATVARWEAGTHLPRGGYLAALHALGRQARERYFEIEAGWRRPQTKKAKTTGKPKAKKKKKD